MRVKISALYLLAVFLAGSCAASTVAVTPENMRTYGWSIETTGGAKAAFANYGYAVAQRPSHIGNPGPFIGDDTGTIPPSPHTNLGQGAFYVALTSADISNTAWLGLDKHNGQSLAGIALSRIKTLTYFAFNAHLPTALAGGGSGDWNSWTYWEECRQPIQLQITVQSPDGSDRKQFWCLPFEPKQWSPGLGAWLRGDMCGINTNKWIKYDVIHSTSDPYHKSINSYWYCPDPELAYQTWADLIATYGNYTLVPTSTYFDTATPRDPLGWKSAGWDDTTDPAGTPLCTATGKCINFEIGARKTGSVHVYMCMPDEGQPPDSGVIAWTHDSRQFRGYADYFTLGIDYNGNGNDTDAGEKTTYNFEPTAGTPPPKIVCMSVKSAFDPIMVTPTGTGLPGKTMVKLGGQISDWGNPRFWVSDPYGPQKVVCYTFNGDAHSGLSGDLWPNPTQRDEYWSVYGILERPVIEQNSDASFPVWSSPGKLQFYY